jgi:hypothetical protein
VLNLHKHRRQRRGRCESWRHLRPKSCDQVKSAINFFLTLVRLETKKDQYPNQLSGGQRQRVLSPDQYEIVGVRTPKGMKRTMLIPKAVLKAMWEAEAPLCESWGIKRRVEKKAATDPGRRS